jgi:hypothetical protein
MHVIDRAAVPEDRDEGRNPQGLTHDPHLPILR